jgi:hypothetical protein
MNPLPISGSDPRTLLTAMLQGVQAKKGKPGYILTWGIDAKKGTTLSHFSPNLIIDSPWIEVNPQRRHVP